MIKILYSLFVFTYGGLNAHHVAKRSGLVANGANFTLDGAEIRILSGAIHYFRIPNEYWKDRLEKLRGSGLNTVETYVSWNLHEPQPNQYNFQGDLDIVKYIKTAQEVGLNVLLRPGPYICAELGMGWNALLAVTTSGMIFLHTQNSWFF